LLLSYLLLVMLPLAGIVYIVWNHRRKTEEREAARTERLREMLGTVHAMLDEGAGAGPVASVTHDSETPQESTAYVRRERILDRPQTLLYYLLRTALPDYVLLAQIPLALAVDVKAKLSPYAREEAMRKVASHTIDFLVCDRSMVPLAAVQLVVATNAVTTTADTLQSYLSEVGIRYIELDGTALPRKDAIRSIILGDEAAPAHSEPELEVPAT